jgi:hypothetical protein
VYMCQQLFVVFRPKKRCKVVKIIPLSHSSSKKHPSDYECTNSVQVHTSYANIQKRLL